MNHHTRAKHLCATPVEGPSSDGGFPRLSRLNYFYGQALGHHDFADEQRYFREKLRLHNRCLHGWGVICGLRVSLIEGPLRPCASEPSADAESLQEGARALEDQIGKLESAAEVASKAGAADAAKSMRDTANNLREQARSLRELAKSSSGASEDNYMRLKIRISPGVALDRQGRELVLPQPLEVDLWALLDRNDRRRLVSGNADTVHVSLCYYEAPLGRVRPIVPDPCGPVADNYTRILEGVKIELRVDAEPIEELCNFYCEERFDADCVPLARIIELDRQGEPPGTVDHSWRRDLATYDPVRVIGISWEHGCTYSPDSLHQLLGRTDQRDGTRGTGLELRFSRPVRADSFKPGVFEVLRYAGGQPPAGGIAWLKFEPDEMNEEFVDRVVYRQATNERWSPGDRMLIRLRSAFVLDRYCMPLDGTHVGGRVPKIGAGPSPEEAETPEGDPCAPSPRREGPWTSGNGVPGGDFVSWIFAS